MPRVSEKIVISCLKSMLRPVAAYCVKNSLRIQDTIEALKVVFLEAAERELLSQGEKVSASRLSIATGVHRAEVKRVHLEGEVKDTASGLIPRLMGTWRTHRRFTSKSGRPRVLTEDEFAALVAIITKDTHPGTVVFEMERVGVLERTKNGLKLTSSFLDVSGDPEPAFEMLGEDVASLIRCVEENVFGEAQESNLHLRTIFDNVRVDEIENIRAWIRNEGTKFQDRIERYLAKFDQDVNPQEGAKGGTRVYVNAYSLVQPESD